MDMVEFLCQEDDAPPFRVVIEKRRVLGLSEYPTTGETLIIIAGRKRLFGGGYEQHYLTTKELFEQVKQRLIDGLKSEKEDVFEF